MTACQKSDTSTIEALRTARVRNFSRVFSFILRFEDTLVASDVFLANTVFPFAYTVDYFSQIIFEFLVCQAAGTLDSIHYLAFVSACSYADQNIVLTHNQSLFFLLSTEYI